MTNDSTPAKQNEQRQTFTQNETAPKPERFSDVYKRTIDGVTMSPELRERVLRLQNRKPEPLFLRIIRPAACVAACLVVIVAARQLSKTDTFQLSTADTGAAANSTALSSNMQAAYAPETAYDTADMGADSSEGYSAAKSADTAEEPLYDGSAYSGEEETAIPEDAPAQSENGNTAPSSESDTRIEPYVLSASTGMPPEDVSVEEGSSSTLQEESSSWAPREASSSVTEDHASSESGEAMEVTENIMAANPVSVYETLSEAEAMLGWRAKLPDIPYDDIQISLINEKLLQLQWNNNQCSYRMAKAELGDDISGDYNAYPASAAVENGYTLQLRGQADDAYTLLIWQADGYSYAYACDTPMAAVEAIALVKGILEK